MMQLLSNLKYKAAVQRDGMFLSSKVPNIILVVEVSQ